MDKGVFVCACTACIQWTHIVLTLVNMHRLMKSIDIGGVCS